MSIEGQKFYPGEGASAREILALADAYRAAAAALVSSGRRRAPISQAPYRLVAIHSIELYLNAFLLASGHSATELRRLQHDFSLRISLAQCAKLALRKRTQAHLTGLSERREYLATRYDPAPPALSELNRLEATLNEVAEKVVKFVQSNAK